MTGLWLAMAVAGCAEVESDADGAGGGAEGGAEELREFEFTQMHMGGPVRVVVWAEDREHASRAGRAAFARVAEVDRALSDYREDSELSRLNAGAGGEAMAVGEDTMRVLQAGRRIAEQTGGAFDMTAGPVVGVWREARREGVLPDEAEQRDAAGRVDWRAVEVDEKAGTARLAGAGMRLDAGGIGKGYAADAAMAALVEHGIERAMVQLSGDIVVSGPPPGEAGWAIGLPGDDGQDGDVLELVHGAVSTSGHTQQYMEVDGVRYSHIIDPRTGQPVTNAYMATVVAGEGMTADALATAATVLGPEAMEAVVQENYGDDVRVMVREGN